MSDRTIECYIRFAGLQRSGNHAVINWLIAQYRGRICFRNNVQRYGHLYKTASNSIISLGGEARSPVDLTDKSDKQLFLASFEDKPVRAIFSEHRIDQYSDFTGHKLDKFFHVILLRDPFNHLASRLRAKEDKGRAIRADAWLQRWKSYAKVFLEFSEGTKPHQICVNYNAWLICRRHREEICYRLGIPLSNDDARLGVPSFGGGSSFSGRQLQPTNEYLNRWRLYRHHPVMKLFLRDRELLNLSDEIFSQTILSKTVVGTRSGTMPVA